MENEEIKLLHICDDILKIIEYVCKTYIEKIDTLDSIEELCNYDILEKILDKMIFLNLDIKVVNWYEEYMSQFCGCYVTKKDGSEYYFKTIKFEDYNAKTLWVPLWHVGYEQQIKHDTNKYFLFSELCVNEIKKDQDKTKGNRNIHIYTKKNLIFLNINAPIIITTKLSNYAQKIGKMCHIFQKEFNPDILFDIKAYINNINYCFRDIADDGDKSRMCEKASGFIPKISLYCSDIVILDTHKYCYIEYSYFNVLNNYYKKALTCKNVFFLNGEARATYGVMYLKNYKEMEYLKNLRDYGEELSNGSSDDYINYRQMVDFKELDTKILEDYYNIYINSGIGVSYNYYLEYVPDYMPLFIGYF